MAQVSTSRLAPLEELYLAHHRALLGLAFALVGERSVAEELTIETLLESWRQPGCFDETSLRRALARSCASYLRQAGRLPATEPADGAAIGPADGPWAQVPAVARAALLLALAGRLLPREIAAVLGWDEAAVRRLLVEAPRAGRTDRSNGAEPAPRSAMIVDDDPISLEVYADLLRAEGYRVDTAEDGVSALERMRAYPPHCLVTDLAMPRMDGWQLVRTCRAEAALADVFVVVLSGVLDGSPSEQRAAEDLGVPILLAKPLQPDRLVAALEQARPSPARPPE